MCPHWGFRNLWVWQTQPRSASEEVKAIFHHMLLVSFCMTEYRIKVLALERREFRAIVYKKLLLKVLKFPSGYHRLELERRGKMNWNCYLKSLLKSHMHKTYLGRYVGCTESIIVGNQASHFEWLI